MALSEKGASYPNQAHIASKDRLVGEALDSLASQVQAVGKQANAKTTGSTAAPGAPTALSISHASGFATATITDAKAIQGTAYLLEYSTTANFHSPVRIDNGISKTWSQYLAGKTLYFRVAATFYTSPQSPWTYYGKPTNPIAVTI